MYPFQLAKTQINSSLMALKFIAMTHYHAVSLHAPNLLEE
jgi:hypothetical protein